MMRLSLTLAAALAASPALAATGPFFSLGNTDFVVLLAFLLFVGVLIYLKVPGLLMGLLDKRADTIPRRARRSPRFARRSADPACRFRA